MSVDVANNPLRNCALRVSSSCVKSGITRDEVVSQWLEPIIVAVINSVYRYVVFCSLSLTWLWRGACYDDVDSWWSLYRFTELCQSMCSHYHLAFTYLYLHIISTSKERVTATTLNICAASTVVAHSLPLSIHFALLHGRFWRISLAGFTVNKSQFHPDRWRVWPMNGEAAM